LPPPLESSSRPQSSAGPQNSKALPSFGTIMPITGGSAMEFETKKQRSNYFRSVNTIINDGQLHVRSGQRCQSPSQKKISG
jgi:hypothetical protein